nr:MAG: putative lysis protein [Leviviridae sp.]
MSTPRSLSLVDFGISLLAMVFVLVVFLTLYTTMSSPIEICSRMKASPAEACLILFSNVLIEPADFWDFSTQISSTSDMDLELYRIYRPEVTSMTSGHGPIDLTPSFHGQSGEQPHLDSWIDCNPMVSRWTLLSPSLGSLLSQKLEKVQGLLPLNLLRISGSSKESEISCTYGLGPVQSEDLSTSVDKTFLEPMHLSLLSMDHERQ